jgi:hypothetical protein
MEMLYGNPARHGTELTLALLSGVAIVRGVVDMSIEQNLAATEQADLSGYEQSIVAHEKEVKERGVNPDASVVAPFVHLAALARQSIAEHYATVDLASEVTKGAEVVGGAAALSFTLGTGAYLRRNRRKK